MKRMGVNFGLSMIGPIALIIILSIPIGPLSGGLGILQPWGGLFDVGRGVNEPINQTLILPGLEDEVVILIDEYGVPHIYASNAVDAYVGLGYMHAKDRLFQMVIQNRLASGRISEIMGGYANSSDKIYRTIGLKRAAEASLEWFVEHTDEYPEAQYALDLMAGQIAGINYFVEHMTSEQTPVEFKILGLKMEPWTMVDMFLGASFITWSLTGDFDDFERLWLKENMQNDTMYEQLYPDIFPYVNYTISEQTNLNMSDYSGAPGGYPIPILPLLSVQDNIPVVDKQKLDILISELSEVIDPFGLKDTFGSNNWAISGNKSATGSPMVCMDAHMPLTAPNLVYEAHICVPGEFNVRGITLPGMPSVEAGFNDYIAWGFTNGGVDVLDIFVESLNPANSSEYLYNGEYRAFELIREDISTLEGEVIPFEVKISVHGPLIDGIIQDDDGGPANLAMNWTGNSESHLIMAALQFNKAQNMEQFFDAIYWWDNPVFNLVYADNENNIAMTVCGRFPVRSGYTGLFPVSALNDSVGMVSFIPYAHLPREINPSRGFCTSTNQRSINPIGYNYTLVGPFADGYRSRRISELLAADDSITVEDMMRFQADAIEIRARTIVPFIVSAWDSLGDGNTTVDAVVDLLRDWDYEMATDLAAPTVWIHLFDALRYEMFDELHFLETLLTNADFKSVALPSSIYPRSPVVEQLIVDGSSNYFDDGRTEGVIEVRDEILVRCLHRATNIMHNQYGEETSNWIYGLHHTLNIEHMAGMTTIEGGPIRGQHTLFPSHGWEMTTGPVYRYILDLDNRLNSRIVVAGGQSGNIFSPHFDDLFQLYFEFDEVERHYHYHAVNAYTSVVDFISADTSGLMIERRINLIP